MLVPVEALTMTPICLTLKALGRMMTVDLLIYT